jgi:hypothetical protein
MHVEYYNLPNSINEYGLIALSTAPLVYLLVNSFFKSSRKLKASTAAKLISQIIRKQTPSSVAKLNEKKIIQRLRNIMYTS